VPGGCGARATAPAPAAGAGATAATPPPAISCKAAIAVMVVVVVAAVTAVDAGRWLLIRYLFVVTVRCDYWQSLHAWRPVLARLDDLGLSFARKY